MPEPTKQVDLLKKAIEKAVKVQQGVKKEASKK